MFIASAPGSISFSNLHWLTFQTKLDHFIIKYICIFNINILAFFGNSQNQTLLMKSTPDGAHLL